MFFISKKIINFASELRGILSLKLLKIDLNN